MDVLRKDGFTVPPGDPNDPLLEELIAIGGNGVSRVAMAADAIVARLSGEDMLTTHQFESDLLLAPASPCRMAIKIDGVGEQLLRLCPNTLVVLRHGHTYDLQYTECDRFLAAVVRPEWFVAIARHSGAQDPHGREHVIDTILNPDIPPIIAAIRRHLAFPQNPHERFIRLNIELLISHYFWHQAAEHYEPPLSSGLSNGRLQNVLERIENGLEGRILVADLARAATMTPSQFSRSFKTKLGVSPQNYILERRVAKVQDLLEATTIPLAEVAYEAGFSSQAHMTATFAKRYGITPGEYRKHLNNSEAS